jgi:HEAT repeat protein
MRCQRLVWAYFLIGVAAVSGLALATEEETLKQANVASDPEALLKFFQKRTLNDARRDTILMQIARLGDDSFEVREQAAGDLAAQGDVVVPLLRQAIGRRETDVEIVRRAEKILEKIAAPASEVSAAAARLLGRKKPPGAAAVLLAYLPFADDDRVAEGVRAALAAVAVREGAADRAVIEALADKLPARRGAAAEALIRAGAAEPEQALRKFLDDPDAGVRLRAALAWVDRREKAAVPTLIALLAELPQDQAWQAEEVLCRLAGDQAPNVSLGSDPASQKKCRAAWSDWWSRQGPTLDLGRLNDPARLLGYTLIVQIDPNTGVGKVQELDIHKQVRWQITGLHYPVDARVVRADRVLIAEYNGHRVTERNFKGDVLWEKRVQSPVAVQRLAGGNTFIACHHMLLLVDGGGKEVFSYNRPNYDIMAAAPLSDGQFFLVTNGGQGVRVDASGKETKTFATGVVQQFTGLDVLPDGKVLLPQASTGKIVELDAEGKIGKSFTFAQATSAVRLPNGNTLTASFNSQRVVELDSDGKPAGEFRPDGRPWKARKR